MQTASILVGVDGGATSVRAHVVVVRGGLLAATGAAAAETFAADGVVFEPVPLAQQLDEQARGATTPTAAERRESAARARSLAAATARALAAELGLDPQAPAQELAARLAGRALRIGWCWPGLKSADGRGVLVAKNGPRALDFAGEVESALRERGIELASPLPPPMSDGLACGLGERLAEQGALRGVQHGWYFGGGTGLAEAALVDGAVRTVDALGPGWKRGWELRSRTLQTGYEELLSARGVDEAWRAAKGTSPPAGTHAVDAALAGDEAARTVLRRSAAALAELAMERLLRLHADRGLVLQRVVVGQRLGAWLADERLADCLSSVLRAELASRLASEAPPAVLRTWLPEGVERPERVVASLLHAAPALGAASVWLQQEGEEAASRA